MRLFSKLTLGMLLVIVWLSFGIVTATWAAGGDISGVVKDDNNTPIANADVWVENWNGGWAKGTQTNDQGQYTISGLSSGQYRVGAQATGRVMKFYNNTLNHSQATAVQVNDDAMTASIDFALEAGGTISGIIKDKDGNPLEGIGVGCGRTDGEGGNRTTTAADGSYILRGLAFGSYNIQAAGGWGNNDGNWTIQYYDGKTQQSQADLVSILDGNPNATGINFTLTGGGSISGVVKDDNNTSIANADVWVENWNGGWVKGTQTNDQGQYSISGLSSGQYRVGAQATGRVMKFYNNTLDYDQATAVQVNDGAMTADIDFAMEAGGTISGTIKDKDGNPLAGISVGCGRTDGPGGNGATTEADGSYVIRGLPFGSYKVNAPTGREANDANWSIQFYNGKSQYGEADLVSISAGSPNATGIDFTLMQGGTISGTIKDKDGNPLAGISVGSKRSDGAEGPGTTSAADGSYKLRGVALGNYRIKACVGWGANDGNWSLQYYNGKTKESEADLVGVTADNLNLIAIDFTLTQGGSISGTIKDKDGNPLAGIGVKCWRTDGATGNGTITAADGSYTIASLAFGSYKIQAPGGFGDNDGNWAIQYYNGKTQDSEADLVSVSVDNPNATGIDFTLLQGGSISGTVKDELGNPVVNAKVWAEKWNDHTRVNETQTDVQGNFTIQSLAAGQYRVFVEISDQERIYYLNTANMDEATAVTVTAGNNTSNIDFTISSKKCFIATAAYGSYLDPHIQVLRNFRDKVLLRSSLGKWLVVQYYKYSPPLAAIIARSEGLRFMVRILLTPVILMVEFPKIGGAALILVIFIFLLRINKRHRVQRQAIV